MRGTHLSTPHLPDLAEKLVRRKTELVHGILRDLGCPTTRIVDVTFTDGWLAIIGASYTCRANIYDEHTWASIISDGWICMNGFEFCGGADVNLRDAVRALRNDQRTALRL